MLTLKVANKALIKSTWKELPCQKERQRHKSLPLFNGLCPFIRGRQPWRLWPLCPVCRVVYSPGYKSQWKSCANTMHRKAGSSPGPVGMDPAAGASPLLFARDFSLVAGQWPEPPPCCVAPRGEWHLWGKPPM